MQTAPFKLRDHLVIFLFNEFKSEQSVLYKNIKTKAIKIDNKSSLGRIIRAISEKYNYPSPDYFKIQFTIRFAEGRKKYEGQLFKQIKEDFLPMEMTEFDINTINAFFEDLFRTCFVFYVDGFCMADPNKKMRNVINTFIEEYQLDDVGFDTEALRVLYYREKKKLHKLSRFQKQCTNRAINS